MGKHVSKTAHAKDAHVHAVVFFDAGAERLRFGCVQLDRWTQELALLVGPHGHLHARMSSPRPREKPSYGSSHSTRGSRTL